jgi:hypothetical protein
MVPALFWGEDFDEIKREHVVLGLATGWYYLDEIPARLLQDVGGPHFRRYVKAVAIFLGQRNRLPR